MAIIYAEKPSESFLEEQKKKNNQPAFKIIYTLGGVDYDLTDRFLRVGTISKEVARKPDEVCSLVISDMQVTFSNNDRYLSDRNPDSILYGKDYINSEINVWVGFRLPNGDIELLNKAKMKVIYIEIHSESGEAIFYCKDVLKDVMNLKVGEPKPDGSYNALLYSGTWRWNDIVKDLLTTYAGLSINDLDIETVEENLRDVEFENKTIGECLGKLALVGQGNFYTVAGKVYFRRDIPRLELEPYEYRHTRDFAALRYRGQDEKNMIQKIKIFGFPSFVYSEIVVNADKSLTFIDRDACKTPDMGYEISVEVLDAIEGGDLVFTIQYKDDKGNSGISTGTITVPSGSVRWRKVKATLSNSQNKVNDVTGITANSASHATGGRVRIISSNREKIRQAYAEKTSTAVSIGKVLDIENEYIQDWLNVDLPAVIAEHTLARYELSPNLVDVRGEYLPSLEIKDVIKVYDKHTMMDGVEFQIFRFDLQPTDFVTNMELIRSNYGFQWGFMGSNAVEVDHDWTDPNSQTWDTATDWERLFCYMSRDENKGLAVPEPNDYFMW